MILLCGNKAGVLALKFFKPKFAVCYDELNLKVAKKLGCLCYSKLTLDNLTVHEEVILLVHGREIVRPPFLTRYKCFNIHPYLYCYKGADPIGRAIKDKNKDASVGLHWMTSEIDSGKVIYEPHGRVKSFENHDIVYDQIYGLYKKCFKHLKEML